MNAAPNLLSGPPRRQRSAARFTAVAVLVMAAATGWAQQPLYRVVGPDGRVTYTDRPPAAPTDTRPVAPAPSGNPSTAGLPSDLAAIVARYPVQLFTGPNCASCEDARSLLRRRGVPYRERTVTTASDAAEVQRLTGDRLLPSLMVGRQPVAGFRAAEWGGWLDAAGYPAVSRLPTGWRPADPMPLTVPPPAARPAVEPSAAPSPPPAPAPGAGGIRF